ncbi:MAG: glutamate--tRNA ligase [bacterium]|nr:glutamate--tRNA ligase [bacterium]
MDTVESSGERVRVRFAPSPTGYLHVGGARTALFNWLFARRSGGAFILRVEDTDARRSTREAADAILDSIRWLGLDWDEGPFFQSQRATRYERAAARLLEEGRASLSEERRGARPAVILRAPAGRIAVSDLIHGSVEFDLGAVLAGPPGGKEGEAGGEAGTIVLMKSDGTPTYNFACAVDDAEMGVTHVIRGDDHLSNAPKQVVIYEALGIPPPRFAHVPLILGPDGRRLSKRHGATSVGQYRDEGFLPEALVNFLALLGWSPGDGREMMDLPALIEAFSLDRVSTKSAVFDPRKLAWLNMQYLKKRPPGEIARMGTPFLIASGVPAERIDVERLERVVRLLGERFRNFRELADQARCFFDDEVRLDDAAVARHLRREGVAAMLGDLAARLERVAEFDEAGIERAVRGLVAELKVKAGAVMQPARVAVTGRAETPGLFEVLALLGRETVVSRLRRPLP